MSDMVGNPEDRFSRVEAQMVFLCKQPSKARCGRLMLETVKGR